MKVFLDVDGVLVDFVGGLHKTLGIEYSYDNYPYEKGVWNMFPYIGGLPFQTINSLCIADFWANLEWMHDGHDILRAVLENFDEKDVYLLTTPMPNPGSGTGKMQWVRKNLSEFEKRLIISSAPKRLLASGNLLIDDKDKNCSEWAEAGGTAFQIARPWNSLHDMAHYFSSYNLFAKGLAECRASL